MAGSLFGLTESGSHRYQSHMTYVLGRFCSKNECYVRQDIQCFSPTQSSVESAGGFAQTTMTELRWQSGDSTHADDARGERLLNSAAAHALLGMPGREINLGTVSTE